MAAKEKFSVILPRTQFPMRASLAKREPDRIAHWEKIGLYRRLQEQRQSAPTYILHDGPPFTNGDVHIGTALNKILKDIIIRFKTMRGYRAPYVPGWDCHGLPIEFKVSRQLQEEGKTLDPPALREACAEFSRRYIKTQREQFRRLGIMADWAHEYRTMDPAYEAKILETFAAFVEKGLVYRSQKPVYWSIPVQSALAEAEIEYKEHVSPSVYVSFPWDEAAKAKLGLKGDAVALIWTTTPWTLPANMGLAVHPEMTYLAFRHEGRTYVMAEDLLPAVAEKANIESPEPLATYVGKDLVGLKTRHPFIDRASPVVPADYVTAESGTGIVHTAPGHGLDDYLTGKAQGLEVYNPIDSAGCYVDDGLIPASLVGKSVAEAPHGKQKGISTANGGVLSLLKETGSLFHFEKYRHSYPHCWRSKTPVIFRAVDQWFVSLDEGGLRQELLKSLGEVNWTPGWASNRIHAAIEGRPDWCISRQRTWGVPIPAFFDAEGNALLDAEVIRAFARQVSQHGTNLWFDRTAQQLAADLPMPSDWQGRELIKGMDTLDVWIDSGSSHRAVLQQNPDLTWPADLYLEGTDQHRGWFQSSLWTAIVADGTPPYKNVITHGFIVEQSGEKVSKSGDKPMTADSFVNEWGADIVRLWVSSQDYRNDVPIADENFKQISLAYRTIRNTLRFQLGNLESFDLERDGLPLDELLPLDRWALDRAARLVQPVTEAYEAYEFHRVFATLNLFCTQTLSAIYHSLIKDRLYTLAPNSQARRSAQTAVAHIFDLLNRLLAPILLFTTDEAYAHAQGEESFVDGSIHLADWPDVPANWLDDSLSEEFEQLHALRERVNEQLEQLRQEKKIGQGLDAEVDLTLAPDSTEADLLSRYTEYLPELFGVSVVTQIHDSSVTEVGLTVLVSERVRCPRCWRRVESLVSSPEGEVCERCAEALAAIHAQTSTT